MQTAAPLFPSAELRVAGLKPATFLPTSRAEMDALGWQQCDVIVVTGDAYVDHPSFGMAIIGRLLEAQGFKVGIIAQPDWRSTAAFEALGAPRLFFGVTGGNMDSMVNRYTSDRRVRSDDAYTPGGVGGKRPDRCVIVYSQRVREAYKTVPIVLGGIEASLRRIAHFDYWSENVRRSVLVDSKADLLVYGNAERQIGAIAQRLHEGCAVSDITDLRGTAFVRRGIPTNWVEIDSTELDTPGPLAPAVDPYASEDDRKKTLSDASAQPGATNVVKFYRKVPNAQREHSVIRLPSFEQVSRDAVLYAHASRILHLEANPGNARALVQRHGTFDVWLNPPPIPLATADMDAVYELPYARAAAPALRRRQDSRLSHDSFFSRHTAGMFWRLHLLLDHRTRRPDHPKPLRGLGHPRDRDDSRQGCRDSPASSRTLGGPTANMYRLHCKSRCGGVGVPPAVVRVSRCICPNLNTDHAPLINLYTGARVRSRASRKFWSHPGYATTWRSNRRSTSKNWRPTTPAAT